MKNAVIFAAALMFGLSARAFDYAYIPDASQLKWQLTTDGKAYLRNLNQFNGAFQGCCYVYWIDTATPAGKSIWAALLLKIGGAQPIYLGGEPSGGQILHIGVW